MCIFNKIRKKPLIVRCGALWRAAVGADFAVAQKIRYKAWQNIKAPTHKKQEPPQSGGSLRMVPVVGVEPTRYCYLRILSPTRLPIPPYRHNECNYNTSFFKNQVKNQTFVHRAKKSRFAIVIILKLLYNYDVYVRLILFWGSYVQKKRRFIK